MSLRGETRVQILETNGISNTVATQISDYRGSTKTVIHKVNRNLDKKFYINRVSFTEESNNVIVVTAKITIGEKQDADVIQDKDIENVMSMITDELSNHTSQNIKTKVL
jgi:hypothetical protein